MKNLSKKEVIILASSLFLVAFTALIMINQFSLHKQLEKVQINSQLSTQPQISWFEETNIVTSSEISLPVTQAYSQNNTSAKVNYGQGKTYVINKNSKKIHSPGCQYAKNMNEENKETIVTDNLSEYFDKGYSVCSKCGAE